MGTAIRIKDEIYLQNVELEGTLSQLPVHVTDADMKKKKFFDPCSGMQLALSTNVKKPDRGRCCEKHRNVDQQCAQPANRRSTCGRI